MDVFVGKNGKGLNILVLADSHWHHCWMVFALWYSIQKILPDAKVIVAISRGDLISTAHYGWMQRCGVKYFYCKKGIPVPLLIQLAQRKMEISKPWVIMVCETMAIRQISDDLSQSLMKLDSGCVRFEGFVPMWYYNGDFGFSQEVHLCERSHDSGFCPFVWYTKCGKFDRSKWMAGKLIAPFKYVDKLKDDYLSTSEYRVLELWCEMGLAYDALYR